MNEQEKLDKLDELMALTKKDPADDGDHRQLPYEHLEKARVFLIGAMPDEYRMNLELAKGAMARISRADTRKHAETLIDSLLAG